MKRIGQALAAVIGMGSLLLAQTGRTADDVSGLSNYEWVVAWDGGASTWCFDRTDNGAYAGDEFGMGRAHSDNVTYDPGTHVLEMQATSEDEKYVAQYTWTMQVDENNVPVGDENGSIVFSQPQPLTQTISIRRGQVRPTPNCDPEESSTEPSGQNQPPNVQDQPPNAPAPPPVAPVDPADLPAADPRRCPDYDKEVTGYTGIPQFTSEAQAAAAGNALISEQGFSCFYVFQRSDGAWMVRFR